MVRVFDDISCGLLVSMRPVELFDGGVANTHDEPGNVYPSLPDS